MVNVVKKISKSRKKSIKSFQKRCQISYLFPQLASVGTYRKNETLGNFAAAFDKRRKIGFFEHNFF